MNRREFLKGIGAIAATALAGKPIYDTLLKREYHLMVSLNEKQIKKFIGVEILNNSPRKEVAMIWFMKKGWVQECVSVTDQYNRPWEIIGYFESLKSPEGWTVPLDRPES